MKTTELFVEQVLIGLLVVLAVALLTDPELVRPACLDLPLEGAAGLVGGAYLIGIIYDRCADTLLQDLEQHHRLWFAIDSLGERKDDETKLREQDPFPEERYRTQLLGGARQEPITQATCVPGSGSRVPSPRSCRRSQTGRCFTASTNRTG